MRKILVVGLFLCLISIFVGCQSGSLEPADPNAVIAIGQGVQTVGEAVSTATGSPWAGLVGVIVGGALVAWATKKKT